MQAQASESDDLAGLHLLLGLHDEDVARRNRVDGELPRFLPFTLRPRIDVEEGTVDGDSHAVKPVELDVLGVGVRGQLVVQFEDAHWAPREARHGGIIAHGSTARTALA